MAYRFVHCVRWTDSRGSGGVKLKNSLEYSNGWSDQSVILLQLFERGKRKLRLSQPYKKLKKTV